MITCDNRLSAEFILSLSKTGNYSYAVLGLSMIAMLGK